MKVSDVLECSLPKWYPKFKKVTIKSIVIPVSEDVLQYFLSSDSLILPKECIENSEQVLNGITIFNIMKKVIIVVSHEQRMVKTKNTASLFPRSPSSALD